MPLSTSSTWPTTNCRFSMSRYHAIPGALTNAIDFLYDEWRNKSAGFVGYGLLGATRAVEQLRSAMAELHIADVRDQVALSVFTDFIDGVDFAPAEHHEPVLQRMLDQIIAWADALAPLPTRNSPRME